METKALQDSAVDVLMKNWFETLLGVVITIFTPLDYSNFKVDYNTIPVL